MGKHKSASNRREHVLVCLSSAPANTRAIYTAAKMAKAFDCYFTALFVETPDFAIDSEKNKIRLEENRKLAEQLGASVEIVFGDDVPYQIAEYARLSGVTQIVIGQSADARGRFFGKPTMTKQLLSHLPEIEIHIIPDKGEDASYYPRKAKQRKKGRSFINVIKSIIILIIVTLLSLFFYSIGFSSSNVIMVYILGVLATSVATSHRAYSLISSIASVVIFNFLFTEPRFSFTAYEAGYPVTFATMFLTAYITGTFAIRYKEQAWQSAKIARRTKILFDTDQLLSKAEDKQAILHASGQQIEKLLGRGIVIFDNKEGKLSAPVFFPESAEKNYETEKGFEVAEWVLKNNRAAGATTERFSEVRYLYYAVRVNERVYGVVGIDAKDGSLDASENSILLSILGETALALENEKNAREKEAAAVLAESEQLRANLLRSISHDLRTPLTTISGNAGNLLKNGESFDVETKQQIYTDIYDESMWLIDLVEALLYSTRIEEGRMMLNTSAELISEIVEEAMQHIRPKVKTQNVTARCEDEFLLVRADARLIVQVITNLVDNALKYTPADASIEVVAERKGNMAEIKVTDTGNGVKDAEKARIFDKFYCGGNKIADNRRSLGLGLYLCKAIVEAHEGTISVTDNVPRGAVFSFTLPLEEVQYYE